MSAYSFLPWLRRGVAVAVGTAPMTGLRPTVPVHLLLTGTSVTDGSALTEDVNQPVQLYGPGDVIGIDSRAIIRSEPQPWVSNAEPNDLAFVEFYDEDFPWRYSPAAPDPATGRLRPWLALIVLTEEEFTDATAAQRPLPAIDVSDLSLLQPADQLGAWAHVQVNRGITANDTEVVSDNMDAVLPRLEAVLAENPDLASSRVLCPRRLEPDTSYHAFLVPAFETGRLAGLGLEPPAQPGQELDALHGSWVGYPNRPESARLCHYHRWSFRTGAAGDFEHLVRLLRPRKLDARVGNRDLDVQQPHANVAGIPELGGVLRLGGALKVPDENLDPAEQEQAEAFENWDVQYPHQFQRDLAALVNLADEYTSKPAEQANAGLARPGAAAAAPDPDPTVTPPLYGGWHAGVRRLHPEQAPDSLDPQDNWVHELNLDPRFRVAAGLGARVVQERQEELMAAAWAQLGDVLDANRRLRAAQLAREVGFVLHKRHLDPLWSEDLGHRALVVTAPVHSRLLVDPEDPTPQAAQGVPGEPAVQAVQVSLRRHVAGSLVSDAPLSAPMRRITRPGSRLVRRLFTQDQPHHALLLRINSGSAKAARDKTAPPAVVTLKKLQDVLDPTAPSDPDDADLLPPSPDFRLSLPGEAFTPAPGSEDSPEAVRFKDGLRDLRAMLGDAEQSGTPPARPPLNLTAVTTATRDQLHPDQTVPRRVRSAISLPARLEAARATGLDGDDGVDALAEVMAYPVFDEPMYQPLRELSTELLLPNLNRIPPDSITLLERNQRFVEAYMVGLNHEMARELLWREYPSDQRGTPFRQFWDVRTMPPVAGETTQARRERLRDIPELNTWTLDSRLGGHDHREPPAGEGDGDEENDEKLVLVIRGELLKKYPNAVVYAHRAVWLGEPGQGRDLAELDETDPDPPADTVKFPRFEAKVEPDIFFLGFDLTEEIARGDDPPGPGWFFVIKERPGEPRFGLDMERTGPLHVWNDLAWQDVLAGAPGQAATHLTLGPQTPTPALDPLDPDDPEDDEHSEKLEQQQEDLALAWHRDISAADVAYILFQSPVLMAVHAREMLGDA